jgi:hypothetical protein
MKIRLRGTEHACASGQDITRAEIAVTVIHEPLFELGSVR